MSLQKRILISGARSAYALDLARALCNQGHLVFTGDSQAQSITFSSNKVEKYFVWPSPRYDFENFRRQIITLAKDNLIDVIIPTCEEIFYLCQISELEKLAFCWWPKINQLYQLHDKWQFNQLALSLGLQVPHSWLVKSSLDFKEIEKPKDYVVKPIFSRFASKVLFSDNRDHIAILEQKIAQDHRPWVLQERIFGTEYCTYALAHQGSLLAYSCYSHEFTAGRGAGISLESGSPPGVQAWVEAFLKRTHFTGQLAFDFIVNSKGVFALEANPRSTSGLHFLTYDPAFAASWIEPKGHQEPVLAKEGEIKVVSHLALMIYGLTSLNSWKRLWFFLKVLLKKDVIWNGADWVPFFKQIPMIHSFYVNVARRKKMTLVEATTDDIEFNG